MSRSRVRVCLRDGLRLDLNRLARKRFIKFGTNMAHGALPGPTPIGEKLRTVSSAPTCLTNTMLGSVSRSAIRSNK
jgi:hypothetical protein